MWSSAACQLYLQEGVLAQQMCPQAGPLHSSCVARRPRQPSCQAAPAPHSSIALDCRIQKRNDVRARSGIMRACGCPSPGIDANSLCRQDLPLNVLLLLADDVDGHEHVQGIVHPSPDVLLVETHPSGRTCIITIHVDTDTH